MEESVKAKAIQRDVSEVALLPGLSTCPQLTSQEKSQRPYVDDRFGKKSGIIAIGAPRHQMEIHGDRVLKEKAEE